MARLIPFLTMLLVALTLGAAPSAAQGLLDRSSGEDAPVALPERLTPEIIDAMLARMTDGEIRELLRDELVRRGKENEVAESGAAETIMEIESRLREMAERIEERTTRWVGEIADIGSRRERVISRIDEAENGVAGMLLAALLIGVAGIGAALATGRATRGWRTWLCQCEGENYWSKVVRTIALTALDLAPIVVFVGVTRAVASQVGGPLGPLQAYVWIYHAGVSWSWAFIVVTRRAFAPDAPAIRIAPLTDDMARRLHGILRRSVQIGAAGWLIAGFFPTLGFGFPPAMVTVALSGTIVAAVLMVGLVRNVREIREATALVFDRYAASNATARIAIASAPTLLGVYIVGAWIYWLAHWLERGQHRLDGPVGTLIVYLVLPIFDRLGQELVRTMIRSDTELAERFRRVFGGAWRMLIGLFAAVGIVALWGIDLLSLAKGPDAPRWASTGFDILVTLLIGYLFWRLIVAALRSEKRVAAGAEDVDPSEMAAASRLSTLTPLFRNLLLGFLATVVAMIVLSALGVDIGPLIASAGIVGIAIGFGAQSLVRDIFSGIFFLVDDAFRVGEYIELDADMRGEVESISIRSLQLRHHRGPVITIPFGELRHITNHNRDWVIYKMSFRMEPETDPQKFKKIVKEIGKEFLAHPEHGPKFIEPLKSQGVYYVDDDSALVMRVKFKCRPRAQFVLRREIYHRLREVFAENGLHLARRKVEVVGPDGEPVPEGAAGGALPDDVVQPAAALPSA